VLVAVPLTLADGDWRWRMVEVVVCLGICDEEYLGLTDMSATVYRYDPTFTVHLREVDRAE